MHWIDSSIVIVTIIGVLLVAWYTKRHTRSVSDFLSANRCAGRYLLTVSDGMATISLVSILAMCELYYETGFNASWWIAITMLVNILVAVTGWVQYRFRETRALTMAQFFEIRYSKKFRVFSGIVCFLSGIINYGIFPIVTARVIVYLIGMPLTVSIAGFDVQTTTIVMPVILSVAIFMTLSGGLIAVMVTNFLQGSFATIVFVVLIVYMFIKFGTSNLFNALIEIPQSATMVNPIKMEGGEFSGLFFAAMAFMQFYGFMAWQGTQGYNSAAKNPHEARMARVWATWRLDLLWGMLLIFALFAFIIFKNPQFASIGEPIQSALSQIPKEQIQEQMRVPIMLRYILPTGLIGLLCAAFVGMAISTDDSNLHSWGSIFVQDVILPLRKKHLSPKQHIRFLRFAVIGVALFVYCFSLFFPLEDYLFMFMNITGAIFMGGAGCAIIGGLYWKRGNTAGAWAGMITGMSLAILGIVLQNIIWPMLPELSQSYPNITWLQNLPEKFPINGMVMAGLFALIASAVYVVVSLITSKQAINMDRMLHRGKYAIEGEHIEAKTSAEPVKGWRVMFNFGGKEFSKFDRFVCYFTTGWTLVLVLIVIVGSIAVTIIKISDVAWLWYWIGRWGVNLALALVAAVILTVGGFKNTLEMFRKLKSAKRDEFDDGTVSEGHNLADEQEKPDVLED